MLSIYLYLFIIFSGKPFILSFFLLHDCFAGPWRRLLLENGIITFTGSYITIYLAYFFIKRATHLASKLHSWDILKCNCYLDFTLDPQIKNSLIRCCSPFPHLAVYLVPWIFYFYFHPSLKF